jgi:cell division protein FtsB
VGRLKKVLLPAVLLVGAYWAVFGGEYTVLDVYRARAARADEAQEVTRLEGAIDSLSARADSLEHDSETLERIARERYGLIRDGEVLYRFAPSDGAAGDTVAP